MTHRSSELPRGGPRSGAKCSYLPAPKGLVAEGSGDLAMVQFGEYLGQVIPPSIAVLCHRPVNVISSFKVGPSSAPPVDLRGSLCRSPGSRCFTTPRVDRGTRVSRQDRNMACSLARAGSPTPLPAANSQSLTGSVRTWLTVLGRSVALRKRDPLLTIPALLLLFSSSPIRVQGKS